MSVVLKIPALRNVFKLSHGSKRYFHANNVLCYVWERDEKSGYRNDRKYPPATQMIREGLKELKSEIALWAEEVKEKLENDPILIFRPGETDVIWQFGVEESINQWTVTTDKDNNEGFSSCSFSLNKDGHALFSGELSTRPPQDGRIKRAGYCNIKTLRARKSFKREAFLDWTSYNMLVMKVRGDGRSYMLNISSKGYYDIMWNDVFQYVLFTRGGPYWQVSRIPFSKFFLASKGRIQDKQNPLPLNKITSFGISAGDKINGPFQLEIDYIGVEYDPNHTEEFAYEMYKTERYVAAV